MARNRKRAKDRRARRPQGASVTAAGGPDRDAPPDPIEHAAPDVELAEAQLALGRPELAEEAEGEPEDEEFEPDDTGADDDALRAEEGGFDDGGDGDGPPGGGGELAVPGGAAPAREHRPSLIWRLIHFVQGSWRELQRVQWPDRRQVMQATGVVIGFVIVAGVFLGVADFLATKVMNYILTGHFK